MALAVEMMPLVEMDPAPTIVATGFDEEVLENGFTLFTLFNLSPTGKTLAGYLTLPTSVCRPPGLYCARKCDLRVPPLK